jgi:hypothetical protein
MSRAIIIAAALIAAAIVIRAGWTQGTQITPTTVGVVTAACSATVPPFTSGKFNYAVGSVAPITLNAGGEICVSQ